ncbi:MAG: hypothetical protein IJN82_02580 [Clostridia bacterium]|nr:hypothetical protein [Clostridia bacterium]
MYSDIGSKIKGLAKACFIVEAIGCIIGAIAIFSTDAVDEFAIVGILLLILGPLAAWVSSWLIYGFGELIEQCRKTAIESETIKKAIILIAQDTSVLSQQK